MKILIIASHPDDEVLGCGGTVARLIQEGHTAFTLILGEGVKSRDGWTQEEYDRLHVNILNANKKLGINKENIRVFEYPDQRFDTVPLLDIIKTITRVKEEVKPDVVFTHSPHCLNRDHQITFEAVLVATRPMNGETVKTIYSFYIPSSTEWRFPSCFQPNVFYHYESTAEQKKEALEAYKDELRDCQHPRSLIGIHEFDEVNGRRMGQPLVEQFELVRSIL